MSERWLQAIKCALLSACKLVINSLNRRCSHASSLSRSAPSARAHASGERRTEEEEEGKGVVYQESLKKEGKSRSARLALRIRMQQQPPSLPVVQVSCSLSRLPDLRRQVSASESGVSRDARTAAAVWRESIGRRLESLDAAAPAAAPAATTPSFQFLQMQASSGAAAPIILSSSCAPAAASASLATRDLSLSLSPSLLDVNNTAGELHRHPGHREPCLPAIESREAVVASRD